MFQLEDYSLARVLSFEGEPIGATKKMPPQGPLGASLLSLESHGHSEPTKRGSENKIKKEESVLKKDDLFYKENFITRQFHKKKQQHVKFATTHFVVPQNNRHFLDSICIQPRSYIKVMVSIKCVPNMITRVVTSSMISNLYPIYQ